VPITFYVPSISKSLPCSPLYWALNLHLKINAFCRLTPPTSSTPAGAILRDTSESLDFGSVALPILQLFNSGALTISVHNTKSWFFTGRRIGDVGRPIVDSILSVSCRGSPKDHKEHEVLEHLNSDITPSTWYVFPPNVICPLSDPSSARQPPPK
jgi:hypothetical protein